MTRPGGSCPPLESLLTWTLSLLEETAAASMEAHVAGCARCARDVPALRAAARDAASADVHLHPALLARWDAFEPGVRGLELETARRHLDACVECRDDLALAREARAVLAREGAAPESTTVEWFALAQLPAAIERAADAVREFLDGLLAGGAGVLATPVPVRGETTVAAQTLDAPATLDVLKRGERVVLRLPDGASVAVAHDVAGAALVFTDPHTPEGGAAAMTAVRIAGATTTVLAASDAAGEMRLPFRELTGDLALIVRAM